MPVENTETGSRVKKRLYKYNALQITTDWKSYTFLTFFGIWKSLIAEVRI